LFWRLYKKVYAKAGHLIPERLVILLRMLGWWAKCCAVTRTWRPHARQRHIAELKRFVVDGGAERAHSDGYGLDKKHGEHQ
jgi:hypothetical protein